MLKEEPDELDYQMRVELDSKELMVPQNQNQKYVMSKKEQDEKELNEMLK